MRGHNINSLRGGEGDGVHDVEVNYFTCGFTCNIFYFTCELYAYVFTCATSKVISQVKLHVKPQVKSFTSTSCGELLQRERERAFLGAFFFVV